MPVSSGYADRQLGSEIMKFYVDEDISGQTLGGSPRLRPDAR